VDIDGEGDFNEFQAVTNAGNIDFGSGAQNNIEVLSDPAPFNNRYQDKTQTSANGIPVNVFDRIVRVGFTDVQSFKWKFGVRYRDGSGGSSERLFSFYVLCIPEFETEQEDFGDAPSPYPTLNANNGASHIATTATSVPRFGAIVDREVDGLPNANALGDDNDSTDPTVTGDDEDGVTITGSFTANSTKQITINTRGAGRVSGWIDWNRDGRDAGLQKDSRYFFGERKGILGQCATQRRIQFSGATYSRASCRLAIGDRVEGDSIRLQWPSSGSGHFQGRGDFMRVCGFDRRGRSKCGFPQKYRIEGESRSESGFFLPN
jgi:hypothetical protein